MYTAGAWGMPLSRELSLRRNNHHRSLTEQTKDGLQPKVVICREGIGMHAYAKDIRKAQELGTRLLNLWTRGSIYTGAILVHRLQVTVGTGNPHAAF